MTALQDLLFPLIVELRWKHALCDCILERRAYTEIHFYRNPATEELVITYWEIEP